jgi:hypothetical protein
MHVNLTAAAFVMEDPTGTTAAPDGTRPEGAP